MSDIKLPLLENRRVDTADLGEVNQTPSEHKHLHRTSTCAVDGTPGYDHGRWRTSSRWDEKRKKLLFRRNMSVGDVPLLEDAQDAPPSAESEDGSAGAMKGILLVIASTTFFSFAAVVVTLNTSIPSVETGLFRAVYSLIFGSLLTRFAYGVKALPFEAEGSVMTFLMLRGCADFAASNIFYFGCSQIGLGLATVILFTNPFWAAILAKVWLGEPYGMIDFLAALLAFSGVVMSALPSLSSSGSNRGGPYMVLFVFLASFFQAATYCLIKRIAGKVHFMQMTVSYGMVGILIGPGVLTYGVVAANKLAEPAPIKTLESYQVFLLTLLVAVFAILAQVLLNLGCATIPASLAAVIRTMDIPLALIFQYLILGTAARKLEIIGAGIVMVACVGLTVSKQLKANKKEDADSLSKAGDDK